MGFGKWFARWFGSGREAEDTDEPARFAPPQVSMPDRPKAAPVQVASKSGPQPRKGFDPYNSGAFERRNAWERVGRR